MDLSAVMETHKGATSSAAFSALKKRLDMAKQE
jgi:hypothetical protein